MALGNDVSVLCVGVCVEERWERIHREHQRDTLDLTIVNRTIAVTGHGMTFTLAVCGERVSNRT
jgi:hypothetical protein